MDISIQKQLENIGALLPDDRENVASDREQHDIVSRVGYMIGIFEEKFRSDYSLDMAVFDDMKKETQATIIRDLCACRTFAERNYKKIYTAVRDDFSSIFMLPELMPQDSLNRLQKNGVDLYPYRKDPMAFIIKINTTIRERIDSCRRLFPEWLNWNYLRDMFIMENGHTEEGCREQARYYFQYIDKYPHKMYIFWPEMEDREGYLLRNNRQFVCDLYRWHSDEFTDLSRVSDVSERTKNNIYDFIDSSDKCVFLVDCENSDPYALCAAINGLDQDKLEKIQKIILYDDVHAASAWEMLKKYVKIPVEYILMERIKDDKSLVDVSLTAGTCNEFYKNNVDSFVIVSSDSDYWGLIKALPEAKFLLMLEHNKTSPALKGALLEHSIFYCYIDDFYDGTGAELKTDALNADVRKVIKERSSINVSEILDEAIYHTRVHLSPTEVESFRRRYMSAWKYETDDDGNVWLEPKRT